MSHTRAPLLVSLFFLALFPHADAAAPDWEDIYSADGIDVSRKKVENNALFAFRGVGVVNAPIAKVVAVLHDISHAKDWLDQVKEVRLVKDLNANERIEYYHAAVPWPLQDRDFVYKTKFEAIPEKKQVILSSQSVQEPSLPPVSGVVRGEIYSTKLILTSIENGTKTHAVGEAHTDPKGAIPTWIVNLVQKRWPYNTFMNVRRQVVKPNIAEYPLPKEFLEAVTKAPTTAQAAAPER